MAEQRDADLLEIVVGQPAQQLAVDVLVLEPHPASIQDRDGGGPLLRVSRRIFPFIQRVFADSGYAGEKVAKATLIAVEIVRKNSDQVGFAVNPRRWVVGVSSEGHAVMSVKVRPEPKDSGFEAREAWILEPSATELYVNRICTSLPSSLRIA
jgi:hypothetical protein